MLDKELMWVPVISAVANVFLFSIAIGVLLMLIAGFGIDLAGDSPAWLVFMFLVYVIAAFVLSFSQAAISHIVYVRAHGGDATLGQGLSKAFSHWFSLLVWSVITSTVGLVLNLIAERSQLIGKIVTAVLGAAWGIMTYFVVPAMVIDNKTAFASIPKSAQVFKQTWGESLVSNISYSLIFMLLTVLLFLSGIGFVAIALAYEMAGVAVVLLFVWLTAFVFLMLVSSIFAGILKTLLYVYAAEGTAPQNFNQELLTKVLARNATATAVPAAVSSLV